MKLKLLIIFLFTSAALLQASPDARRELSRERISGRIEMLQKISRNAETEKFHQDSKISLEQALKNQNLFFPNPARDHFNVDNSLLVFEKVEVYNIIGSIVTSAEISETKEIKINVNEWERGSYFIRFYAKDKQVIIRKISLV